MKQELYTEVINASVGNHAIHGVEDVMLNLNTHLKDVQNVVT